MSLLLLFNQYEAPISGTAAGGNAEQTGAAFGRVQTSGGCLPTPRTAVTIRAVAVAMPEAYSLKV